MLSGRDIICCSTTPWQAPYGSRQELMSRFARANRVLFVEPQVSWMHPLRYPRLRRSQGWVPGRLRQEQERLWIYTPPLGIPPAIGPRSVNRWNALQLRAALQQVAGRLEFSRPIAWIYAPTAVALLGGLDEAFRVYHCVSAFHEEQRSAASRRFILGCERRLAESCDLVVADSQASLARLSAWRLDALWLPPGIDRGLFSPHAAAAPPEELRDARPPILGYVGSIDDRVDLELLAQVARRWPEATVALVGPVHERVRIRALARLSNVRFIGPKPKANVPAFLRRMDVCLIPFRRTPFTDTILPLKLFEYLAMERPVVATALPELRPYAAWVSIADDERAFLEAVGASLSSGRAGASTPPGPFPSWDDQAERLAAAIEARQPAEVSA